MTQTIVVYSANQPADRPFWAEVKDETGKTLHMTEQDADPRAVYDLARWWIEHR